MLTHEFVDLLTETHTSADKIAQKRAVPPFLAISHTLLSSTNQSEDAIINLQTAAVDPSPQQRRQLQMSLRHKLTLQQSELRAELHLKSLKLAIDPAMRSIMPIIDAVCP